MKTYPIYETFLSVQGEGTNTGRAATFVRLAGCSVGCEWCDSEQAQSTKDARWLTAKEIAAQVGDNLPVVITGGEPTGYDLTELTDELHRAGHSVWLETSGTEPLRGIFDWLCLSPKQHRPPLAENWAKADEIKVVISRAEDLKFIEKNNFQLSTFNLYLQPEWDNRDSAIPLIIEYIKTHPEWRMSLQTHKYIDIR